LLQLINPHREFKYPNVLKQLKQLPRAAVRNSVYYVNSKKGPPLRQFALHNLKLALMANFQISMQI